MDRDDANKALQLAEGSIRRKYDNRVATVKANHFEPYFEPVLSEVISRELEFLKGLE